jgi:predicted nucleic acid-binding protein
MIAAGQLQLCYDSRILSEYRTVLARKKFAFDQDLVQDILQQIESNGSLAVPSPLADGFPDADDRAFAEAAVGCGAVYLITGNRRHFPSTHYGEVEVLLPAEFMSRLRRD